MDSFQKLQNFVAILTKIAVVDGILVHLRPDLVGRWLLLTGDSCLEVDLALKLLGRDLEWSLLTGGCYWEAVVSKGLTVCTHFNNIDENLPFAQYFPSCFQ